MIPVLFVKVPLLEIKKAGTNAPAYLLQQKRTLAFPVIFHPDTNALFYLAPLPLKVGDWVTFYMLSRFGLQAHSCFNQCIVLDGETLHTIRVK